MIKCHLSRLMGEHKVKVSDVARSLNIHRNTIRALYYEQTKRVDIETINALCKYFDCSVSDLFEYIENDHDADTKGNN